MKSNLGTFLLYVMATTFLASALCVSVPVHAAGTVSIINALDGTSNFNFTTAQKSVGDTFLINITISSATNVGTWQVGIKWDNSALGYVSMKMPADNIFADKSPISAPPDNSTPGIVVMGAAVGAGQTAFSGSGTMAQLTLKITKAAGAGQTIESDINFENMGIDTFLLDLNLADISGSYVWNKAHYKYVGPAGPPPNVHDVAVTNVAPSSASVINGSSLNVAVTVSNNGNFTETFAVETTANSTNVAPNQTATNLSSGASTTLTFVWNTTGWTLGDYTLSAIADLPGDPTPADNTLVYGIIHIITAGAGHDVAVTKIRPNNTGAVGRGYPLNVSVTVTNDGTAGFSETFGVTIYANGTAAAPTQTATNLGPGQNATLTFVWNTTGWTIANYTLSAKADLPGDPTPADNTLVYGNIYVMLPGDVNNDGVVNMKDIAFAISYFNAHGFNSFAGEPNYNPYIDVDANGRIDIRDLLIIVINFNYHL